MRKIFFTTILLFVLGIGQIWAEHRTFDGNTKFYVMNYKPSGLGGQTLWATDDNCKFYFCLKDKNDGEHWYEATLEAGSGAYSEGAIYSITPDDGEYKYFIMTRGWGTGFDKKHNQTDNIGFHSDASYNLVNGGYDKDDTGTTWGKVTPKSVTSDGTGVLYFNGSPSSASWWKDYGADRQSAYFFNNTSGEFTTTSVLVSGNYYKVTVPEGTWTGVILTRHNDGTTNPSWDNKCNQTQDIPLVEGKNYLSNFGEAPGTYTWEDFIPTGTTVLNGTMNDWSLITAKAFTDGELAITLPARKTMSFKIVEGNNGSGTWYGLTDANCILSDMAGWGMLSGSDGKNTRINTAGAGTYTFAYNASHQLSVTYPKVKHPNADYVYLIKYGWSSWRIHFEQSSTTYGIAKTTWTGQELTVASGTITDTYDYTAPGEEDAQTYFYYAVGDYPKFNFNDNNNGNQTDDQTPSPGQYMYNDGDSWEWGSFVYGVTLTTNSGTIADGHDVTSYTFGTGATLPNSDYITRTGYTFGGWYNNAEFEGSAITAISTTDNGDTTLYAKWTAKDYTISYDMNDGEWGSGWVGSRTYGEGDVDISSDVVKTDYNFAGWYDNGSFTGEPVTSVSSTLADNITLYAKWTAFSKSTLTPALNPIICTASEGDVVVVTVSATQSDGAYIQLEDKDGVAFGTPVPVSGAGAYAIPLTASDAAKVNAGLIVSGSNYTISAVTIKYQKTLWSGTVSDNTNWTQSAVLSTELFSGLTADDFLGFNISAINDGANWHEYDIRTNWRTNIITGKPGTVGTKIHNLTDAIVDSLQKQTNVIVARYLDVSALYTYIDTKKYFVTLNTNGGTINSGNVNEYTFGTGATLPTDITLTGHTFGGWYPDAEFEEDAVTVISTADYGNKTYYAKWTADEYTVTLNTNDGTIYEGNVTSYTYGVGATLPTNVILWNNNFDGWYDNAELAGDPITSISSTETGNKTYYAKWTSITKAFPVASYPEFLAAQEGDIIVVNVTSTQTGASIYLKDANYTDIANRSLSLTGKHIFQLNADAATSVRTYGVRIEGQNFTFDDVQIRYRKTLWTGTVSDNTGWAQSDKLDRDPFAGLTADDYIGLNISAINDRETWHQYAIRTNYRTNIIGGSTGTTGIVIHNLTDPIIDSLQKQDNIIVAQYLDISALYAYVSTGRFLVIYHDGDAEGDSHAPVDAVESITEGEDETFTISKIIEYRMKVRELDHWYSLYLPFTVSAVKVWDEEDDAYYDLIPYYRDEDSIFYTGHYVIRTPELINDDSIATSDFNKWHDPSSATDYLPAKRTPYIVQWHHSYFQNRYVSFFGAADQSIPTAMTVKAAPKTKNYVSVRGNDAMVDGTVVDAYTLNGDESWERTVDKGESVTIHPFECYIRANSEVTNKYLVIRRGMNFDETPTDFGTIDVSTPVTAKMLIDGQLYIIREGKMYNLQGVMVSEGKEGQQ